METKRKLGRPRKVPQPKEVKVTPIELVHLKPMVTRGTTCPFLSTFRGSWSDCIRASCAMWGGDKCGLVNSP